ncbi:MAG: alpha-ketoglutarate-dependent dioxygenase AlkB [Myxococcota bacterium]
MPTPTENLPTQLGDDAPPPPPADTSVTVLDTRDVARMEGLGAGDSAYHAALLDRETADAAFARLQHGAEIAYQQWHAMPRRNKPQAPLHPLRRIKVAMANPDPATDRVPHYRFPVNNQHQHGVTTPMSPTVQAVADRVFAATGVRFNHAVVLLYRGAEDCIGFHKDKVLDLDAEAPIVSVSLGAVRTYVWRDDIFAPTKQTELRLQHGAMLVLGPQTNASLYHSVRKPTATELEAEPGLIDGVRVSLTFRKVATFVDADGRLHGQGAEYPSLNWPEALRGLHRL